MDTRNVFELCADNTDGVVEGVVVDDEDFESIRVFEYSSIRPRRAEECLPRERLHAPHRLLRRAVVEDDGGDEGGLRHLARI